MLIFKWGEEKSILWDLINHSQMSIIPQRCDYLMTATFIEAVFLQTLTKRKKKKERKEGKEMLL